MSLRLRLLIAVGGVAIIALLVADVATYGSLRSFMLRRVDQALDAAHLGLERSPGGPRGGRRGSGGGPGGGGDDGRFGPPGANDVQAFAPGTYVERRDQSDAVVGTPVAARVAGGDELTPK